MAAFLVFLLELGVAWTHSEWSYKRKRRWLLPVLSHAPISFYLLYLGDSLGFILALISCMLLRSSLIYIQNPEWRVSLLFSDPWHLYLSGPSHLPLAAYLTFFYVPWEWWIPLGVLSWSIWRFVQWRYGKEFYTIWIDVYKWVLKAHRKLMNVNQ